MLRIATEKDVDSILRIYTPYIQHSTATFETAVPSPEEFTDRFRQITEKMPWLVWEENGKVLGYAYGSIPFSRAAYAWCASLSVYLLPEAQGKKIGSQLCLKLEDLLRTMGYRVIYAIITAENEGSVHFHKKLGYQPVGFFPDCGFKIGHWLGVTWMEKRLNPVDIPTEPPKPWSCIVENAELFQNILAILPIS